MSSQHTYQYDIGISCARADVSLVEAVVSQLRGEFRLSVFIDLDHIPQPDVSQENVRKELAEVFENQCALVAGLVTNDWIDSVWCHEEFRAAFGRMRDRGRNFFLPIKFCQLDKRKETGLEKSFRLLNLTSIHHPQAQAYHIADVILAIYIHCFERGEPMWQNIPCPDEFMDYLVRRLRDEIPPISSGPLYSLAPPSVANQDFQIPGIDLEMVRINPGTFLMGSPRGEGGRSANETQHQVTLTYGFWLGKYQLTQNQWKVIMDGSNPATFRDFKESDSHPVEQVTWHDCQIFINRLNSCQEFLKWLPEGYQYCLPTEAEWEYTCRAGTDSPYNGPNHEPLSELGWWGENNSCKTYPVGQKTPNRWGLHDMHGNVWEWCQDGFRKYTTRPETNPSGLDQNEYRMIRGGSWICSAGFCRSAMRRKVKPDRQYSCIGLRLAATPSQSPKPTPEKHPSHKSHPSHQNQAQPTF